MVFEVPMLVGNVDDGSRCHDDDDDAVTDVLQNFFHNFSFLGVVFFKIVVFLQSTNQGQIVRDGLLYRRSI